MRGSSAYWSQLWPKAVNDITWFSLVFPPYSIGKPWLSNSGPRIEPKENRTAEFENSIRSPLSFKVSIESTSRVRKPLLKANFHRAIEEWKSNLAVYSRKFPFSRTSLIKKGKYRKNGGGGRTRAPFSCIKTKGQSSLNLRGIGQLCFCKANTSAAQQRKQPSEEFSIS